MSAHYGKESGGAWGWEREEREERIGLRGGRDGGLKGLLMTVRLEAAAW